MVGNFYYGLGKYPPIWVLRTLWDCWLESVNFRFLGHGVRHVDISIFGEASFGNSRAILSS